MTATIDPGAALATTDTALRLAIADAAVAYVTRNTLPFTAENVTAWERLEAAVETWRTTQ